MNEEALAYIDGGGALGVGASCVVGGGIGVYFAGPVGAVYGCAAGIGFYNGYKH